MRILPLKPRLRVYIQTHGLEAAFKKQTTLFTQNPLYPSLNTELLEPKHLHIYSFRITRMYRVIFIYRANNTIEIIDINNHYQ